MRGVLWTWIQSLKRFEDWARTIAMPGVCLKERIGVKVKVVFEIKT